MQIEEIGTLEAKTNLSALLNQVLEGKSFYLTRRGKRIAGAQARHAAEQGASGRFRQGDVHLHRPGLRRSAGRLRRLQVSVDPAFDHYAVTRIR